MEKEEKSSNQLVQPAGEMSIWWHLGREGASVVETEGSTGAKARYIFFSGNNKSKEREKEAFFPPSPLLLHLGSCCDLSEDGM